MLHGYMSKSEIENELLGKGDFVQIDYLTKFLEENIPLNMKRFAWLKLAGIYEKKNLFSEAGKMFDNIALNSVAFSEKIKNYIKEAELYIKAGMFEKSDMAMTKAMNQTNTNEKQNIYFTVKNLYKKQAENYEAEGKKNHAVRIYEKVLEMNINDLERHEIKEKLFFLYEKLGKFKELAGLKNRG